MSRRTPISLSDLQNTPAGKNPANQALFSSPSGKVSPEREKATGGEEKRTNKYGNRKTEEEGIEFDSLKEAKRYKELRLRMKAGEIKWLARQVSFSIQVQGGGHLMEYIADFLYEENGKLIVEDVKSEVSRKIPIYRAKKRAMLLQHGITITEV